MRPNEQYRWSVSVYARNESAGLESCLAAIARAVQETNTQVTVILNGTTDNSAAVCCAAARRLGLPIEIYSIVVGDKSNAFNQFIYSIRPVADTYFFVDGYTCVDRLAFAELQRSFDTNDGILAATGVPATGRNATEQRNQMLKEGGLHGSLFALKRSTVEKIVSMELKLPIGLYRGDGLINSFLSHDFDAKRNPWMPLSAVGVVPSATWQTGTLSVWRWRDLVRYSRRRIRQARGRFENEAIKEVIYQDGYSALPLYADLMILAWIRKSPKDRAPKLTRDLFGTLAFLQILRHPMTPKTEDTVPRLLS